MAGFESAGGGDVSVDVLWSAAGDILYATADDVGTVLTIGDATDVLQVSGGVPDWVATSGTGSVARVSSPTFVTPALGTPDSGVMTNVSGTAANLTAGNVTTNANLTGHVTSSGSNATTLDLNALTGATVSVANDSIAIIDANDSNGSRKESIADFVSEIAGANVTATSGVLSVGAAGAGLGLVIALS